MSKPIDQARELFEQIGHIADDEKCIELLARALSKPAAGVAVPEGWRDVIHNTLRNYRMSTLDDGEGGGYPLIDAMTADGQTVAGGIEECDYLADALADALVDALAAAPHPVTGEQDVLELRLCEQKHTVLKPRQAYLFTVDPSCSACVELAARCAQQGGGHDRE